MGDSTIVLCMLRRIGYILFIKRSILFFSFSNNDAIGVWKTIVSLIKQLVVGNTS